MKISRIARIGAIGAIAALALAGCAANETPSDDSSDTPSDAPTLSGTLNGMGSSAQGEAQKTWIAALQEANSGLTINYDPQGSGAGREGFISGAVDFAGSDAALSADELGGSFAVCADGSSAIDLPVYISPIAIAYNVDGLTDLKLDATTIAGIFSGKITTWNDAAIAALNEGASLPDAAITVVHRSDGSGTTQNFTEYLAANAADVWTEPAGQDFPYEVGDGAKGTSGVADAVNNAPNSITYIDESGAGDLSLAQLKVGDSFSTLSAEGAAAVVAASTIADGRGENDLAIAIDRTNTDANAWPLVLVSYVIACQEYADADKGSLVSAYAQYLASDEAQQAAAEAAGSAPLTAELAAKVLAAAQTIK